VRELTSYSDPGEFTPDPIAHLHEPGSHEPPILWDPDDWPDEAELLPAEKYLVRACWKMLKPLEDKLTIHQVNYIWNLIYIGHSYRVLYHRFGLSKKDNIAKRSDWKNSPIDNPKRIEISLFLTYKQYHKLVKGLLPDQMEDKWFIFYEKGWLYCHRSWTGFGMYKAK
jgi:hypothetical protein